MDYGKLYDEIYYKTSCGSISYLEAEKWFPFYEGIADKIVQDFNPSTVLDVGCAVGYLVAALRDRGVEAYGIDISEFAISKVREDIKPYCTVWSAIEPLPQSLPQKYDLLITIEVAEHLYEEDAPKFIENICKYSDKIIFSSTPDDNIERTHFNVQQAEYWAKRFAQNNFFKELTYDSSYIAPQTCFFTKSEFTADRLVENYERNIRIIKSKIQQIQKEHKDSSDNSTLFLDYGDGFSGETAIFRTFSDFEFYQEYEIASNVKAIRFDPIEGKGCIVYNLEIISNNGQLKAQNINGIKIDNFNIFTSKDPQLLIDLKDKPTSWIRIKATIIPFETMAMYVLLSKFFRTNTEKQKIGAELEEILTENSAVLDERAELLAEIEAKEAEIDELLKMKETREILIAVAEAKGKELLEMLQKRDEAFAVAQNTIEEGILKLESKDKIIKDYEEKYNNQEIELDNYKTHYLAAINQREDLTRQLEEINGAYQLISKSTIWKMTKPVRKVIDVVKKIVKSNYSLIKRIFYKNYKNEKQNNVTYNIDKINWQNGYFEIIGWIFVSGRKIDSVKLCLRNKNKVYKVDLIFPLRRTDVFQAFGEGAEINCGFKGFAKFQSYKNLDVYLEYTYENKEHEIYLKSIKNGFTGRYRYIKDKLNRQNFKKLCKYIITGRFDFIKDFINRIEIDNTNVLPTIDLHNWIKNNTINNISLDDYTNNIIDVIVPVFNGYQYFDKLFGSMLKTKMKFNLIIINDKSTDNNVQPYLNRLKDKFTNVRLIENQTNLGFVKSVNSALRITKNHVVIVNTDVEFPNQWLERLMLPILKNKKIASVTPFTNAGTICSFPQMGIDNQIFAGLTVDEVDQAFRKIKPVYNEIPTGVGFCMAMNKGALSEVGLLDEDNFSLGYGEENDWCQRAIKKGYKNVMVENLFVYHKHGGSFSSEQKLRLIERNAKLLSQKHPNYNSDVADFFSKDPAKNFREFAIMILSTKVATKKPALFFNHEIGGGATSYLDMQVSKMISENNIVIVISYDNQAGFYLLNYLFQDYTFKYRFPSLYNLLPILNYFGVGEIFINELVTYPEIYKVLKFIKELKLTFDAKLVMLLHDYFSICPTVNLVNDKDVYCNIPEYTYCNNCLRYNIRKQYLEYGTIKDWRDNWKNFLLQCDEIRTFSKSSDHILRKVFGDMDNITVIPHQVNYVVPINKRIKTTNSLNIGLLGILTANKGLYIIESMLKIIEERHLDIRIILLGTTERTITSANFTQTGRYDKESIAYLTLKNDIDIFLIPSIWPETFSYTTEEVIKMSMPVVAFNLGAPAERIKKYEKGMILEREDSNYIINEILKFNEEKIKIEISKEIYPKKILFVIESISFATRYRVEHAMEQLLADGILSEQVLSDDLSKYEPNEYDAVVIYRCQFTKALDEFITQSHNQGKLVYFDVDDYVFEYDGIKHLKFLQDDEYKNFRDYCNKIDHTISLCDKLITSTETLKNILSKKYPDKQVYINRNAASLEMLSLSRMAQENVMKDKNKTYLGYFSGSRTHNDDFSVIIPVLSKLMKEDENIYLKIVGCLELDKRLFEFEKRIIRVDFLDWRMLPKEIASVDINLMPLEDGVFQSCKSENKWMEAALVGVPTIASYNTELALVIENNVDGVLCASSEEWEKGLLRLIQDQTYRKNISFKAQQKVLNNYITVHNKITYL